MMTLELAAEQRRAVDAGFETSLAITGASGTGKTTALVARIERLQQELPDATYFYVDHPQLLGGLARDLLSIAGQEIRPIDDVDAELVFASAAESLFALDWPEIAAQTIDPEVPGLRSPRRFLESAFRLTRKLRDAAIGADEFLERSMAGATEFYGKPPNFAHPDLILATKERYRDSLDVTPEELVRQYRREVDLAKILAELYRRYVALVRERAEMTARDAIAGALEALEASPKIAERVRDRYRYAFIDEAQELTPAQRALLAAIYGDDLAGVTLAGDPKGITSGFRGARPEPAFESVARTESLQSQFRRAPQTADGTLQLQRLETPGEEAALVADCVRRQLDAGIPAPEIALIFRCVADVDAYEAALLDRDVPVAVAGDVNIFGDRRVLDALALLWNIWDPFRHDWMLRTLSGSAISLSDASLATLCAEPPDPQVPLLTFDDEDAPTQRSRRWDPRRDLRLGWNVLYGDQDALLGEIARERIVRFRSLRQEWVHALYDRDFAAFVRLVWSEGLARDGSPSCARAQAQQLALRRLFDRLLTYVKHHPEWTLGDVLEHVELRAQSALETCEAPADGRFVQILDVDRARGRSFEYVVLPDVRAGSFPRWYTPDSFLFSPKLGMIPKDNVGGARAARTAKFTYYVHRTNARDAYNAEERRAFLYALSRARSGALVTASGRPTRGTTAPEFLQELNGTARS
jgi:superfamily I DNA/RNA helicase